MNIKKLDASRRQLNREKFLISLESLKFPRATNKIMKNVSRLDFEA